jgi:DNA invertase Pin-like site-specific DNA recombinase
MRVSIYARVSKSTGQQDPEMQLRELREYAAHRGWEIVSEHVDYTTGAKESRPHLDRSSKRAQSTRRQFRSNPTSGSTKRSTN